jgi:hypothetical protein
LVALLLRRASDSNFNNDTSQDDLVKLPVQGIAATARSSSFHNPSIVTTLSCLARIPLQRRSVSDEPDVTERIGETTLAVNSPGNAVILDAIGRDHRTSSDGFLNEQVGLIDEDFNSDGGMANDKGT